MVNFMYNRESSQDVQVVDLKISVQQLISLKARALVQMPSH